jgi:hypothetical protein
LAAEGGGDRLGDRGGVTLDLVVREAQDAVAGARERGVAPAVVLEGAARAVVAPAVRLDDEVVRGEEEVDLEARGVGVPRARAGRGRGRGRAWPPRARSS